MSDLIDTLNREEMEIEARYKKDKKEFAKQRERLLKEEKLDEASEILFSMYRSLQAQGFTPEQAWELMTITLNNTKSI